MALQVFPSATSKSWDPCHETQKRRRQQDLQIARKPRYLKKTIDNHYTVGIPHFCYFCYRVMIAGFDKTPMNSCGIPNEPFLGFERDFEWSKTAWIFHPHRVTSYFFGRSTILPKYHQREFMSFCEHSSMMFRKIEIGDLNIGDSIQIGHLVAGMLHCVLFFSLTGPVWAVHTQLAGTAVSGVQVF